MSFYILLERDINRHTNKICLLFVYAYKKEKDIWELVKVKDTKQNTGLVMFSRGCVPEMLKHLIY